MWHKQDTGNPLHFADQTIDAFFRCIIVLCVFFLERRPLGGVPAQFESLPTLTLDPS